MNYKVRMTVEVTTNGETTNAERELELPFVPFVGISIQYPVDAEDPESDWDVFEVSRVWWEHASKVFSCDTEQEWASAEHAAKILAGYGWVVKTSSRPGQKSA